MTTDFQQFLATEGRLLVENGILQATIDKLKELVASQDQLIKELTTRHNQAVQELVTTKAELVKTLRQYAEALEESNEDKRQLDNALCENLRLRVLTSGTMPLA